MASHRRPVFSLFRNILRSLPHLPLPKKDIQLLRKETVARFKNGQKLLAPLKTKILLNNAYEWNNHMYNAIVHASKKTPVDASHIVSKSNSKDTNESLKWIKDKIIEHNRKLKYEDQRKKDQKIQWNEPVKGKELQRLQILSRFNVYRNRILRSYKEEGRLSSKSELDNTYINNILIPEYISRKKQISLLKRRQIETKKAQTARLVYVPCQTGTFYFLRPPWKVQSKPLSQYIHSQIHTKLFDQIDNLENLKLLAQKEAEWETQIEIQEEEQLNSLQISKNGIEKRKKELLSEWTEPVVSTLRTINQKINKIRSAREEYLKILMKRKRLIDIAYQGRYKRKLKKWNNYDTESKKNPLKSMTHYDVHKIM